LGHKERVAVFSIALCRSMSLPKDQIEVIARGAFLHDVGKMAISVEILLKPGPLTSDETRTMREHCYIGYQIVKKTASESPANTMSMSALSPHLEEIAELVYTHHENFDGTGYPRGIKGDEIPIGARIIAVANTLDSITTNLPYRPARSLSAAHAEIEKWSGRQFDPEVVKVFLQTPSRVWEDLRPRADSVKEDDAGSDQAPRR